MRVLLLNMPFVALSRPAIGISILKVRLAELGLACSVGYGNLLFAERVGLDAYDLVNDRLGGWMFTGDWLFSECVFPRLDRSAYVAALRARLNEAEFETVMRLRAEVVPFLEACLSRFDVGAYDVVGFTTTFEQNLASLALASLIKQRHPGTTIVFGGANCEGVMGLELHRRFPCIDYVCSGEADDSFPALVARLAAGACGDDIPGVVARTHERSELAAPAARIDDLDRIPTPDYDDYFEALARSELRERVRPVLLIESARGCWWGAKSHCTFCGLNGSTLAFRAKSAERVYAELERQRNRYGVQHVLAVDNIMSHAYFRDLLPMLKERNPGVSLFYEMKANLRRSQVELLRDAGVRSIQPGIESLNSHVLRLMRKGVSALQNVALLRMCREYGIELAWNLLYGFPGETPEDYELTAGVIESLYHLKPPGAVARIRLDRFSPNFDFAEQFGFTHVRPNGIYGHLYHLPPEAIENLAYFFEFDYADGRTPATYVAPALEKIAVWKANQGGDLIKRYGEEPELTLVDTRPDRRRLDFPLNGLQREIYDFCDEIRSLDAIEAFAAERAGRPVAVAALLAQFLEYRLMLCEGRQYLSLAVDPTRVRRPARALAGASA
ncbi:MAG: RiPP maturation radical SAM C-methyltransferase [Vulcanimicrobiaceae bacterium]